MTISVKDFGAIGDGVADDTASIQAAIDASIYGGNPGQYDGQHCPVFLPAGRYRITRTLHLGYGVGGFNSVTFFGDGAAYAGESTFCGTIIVADFWDGPAINVQGARGTKIHSLTLLGKNRAWVQSNALGNEAPLLDDTNPANWINPAAPASSIGRYSPYAGVAVDGYSGQQQSEAYPAVSYPAFLGNIPQYGKAYSSDVIIEDVIVTGFVACVAVQPSDADGNGDFVKLSRVGFDHFIYGVSIGNTQSRNVSLRDVKASLGYCVLTSKQHGRKNGRFQGPIDNLSVSNCIKLFSFGSTSIVAPIVFTNCYSEYLYQIGDMSLTTASESSIVFRGCSFGFEAQNNARGVPALCLSGDGNAVDLRFEGCFINNVPSVFTIGSADARLVGTRIQAAMRGSSTAPDRATALAHNALSGGVVTGRNLAAAPGQSIITTLYNVDTLARGPTVSVEDGFRFTSRQWCIPNHVRLAQPLADPNYCAATKQASPWPIDKLSVTASIYGLVLTMTFASRSNGVFMRLGPMPGDVMIDDVTRSVFFVKTRSGLTITAEAQNNYKNGALLEPVPLNSGNWFVLNSRFYVPDRFLRADIAANSTDLTNAGADDGFAAWMQNAIQPGDSVFVADTVDRWISPDKAGVVAVTSGTITLEDRPFRTETRKRIPVFIRGA